nr:hypothetical protein [Streptomyces sp. C8S0]
MRLPRPSRCADLLDALGVPELRGHADALRAEPEETALARVFTAFLDPPAGLLAAVTGAVAAAADRPGRHHADLRAYAEIARAHPGTPGCCPR